jgi:hypothetical protein
MNNNMHITLLKKAVYTVCFFMLFVCLPGKAQGEAKYTVKFKLSIKDGDLKNALITITKNGSPYKVIDPSGGKYSVDLDFNAEYLFSCTKTGYISKSLIIDTHIPAGKEDDDFAKNYPEVELEKQPEGQEVTYTQPVGKIKYNGMLDDFDFDKDYTQKAQAMQQKAKENPKPKPKEPDPKPISKPEPVVVKQPEYKPEPPQPKPIVTEPVVEAKPIVKNKEEKIIQKDRLKITITVVKVNDLSYEYKKEEYSWGGVYYYRDGKNITEPTYDKETE